MKDIYKTGFGWISPRGNVLGCDCYGHLETLAEWPEVKETLPEIADTLEGLEDIRKKSEDLIAQGEHPEWHCYEIACDREESRVKDALINAGHVRIGTSRHAETVEAEGIPEAIKSRMTTIQRIVKEYNAENRVEYRLRIHSANAQGEAPRQQQENL